MSERDIKNLVAESIARHQDELARAGLAVDEAFYRDLAEILRAETERLGLEPVLAETLLRTLQPDSTAIAA